MSAGPGGRDLSDDSLPFDADITQTATSALSMLPVGARLADRYRILAILGAGGMGVVYRAHDEQLDAEIAVKVLRAERRLDEAGLQRFRDEIRLARKITHPAVVRIHDIGRDGDTVFLTMDCVEGRSLREMLADGPLATRAAVSIARQIAEGLAAAHEQGVIHRDLKPDNILVASNGRAYLADFGIAQAAVEDDAGAGGGEAWAGAGIAGSRAGTLAYLAPEQARGEAVDERADVYALGLVLYEMLAGARPLAGSDAQDAAASRAAGRAPSLAPLKRAPRRLRAIVARCLKPSPDERYQQAGALAQDLAKGASDILVKRAAVIAAAGAAAAALMVGAAMLMPAPGADREAGPAAEGPPAMRLAVLPFANHTGLDEYDWVRRGLPETLSGSLAENPELLVVESARVFQTIEALRLDETRIDASAARQLAALLDVNRFVGGTVVGDAQSMRLELSMRSLPDGAERQARIDIGPGGLLPAADESVDALRRLLDLSGRDPADAPLLSENPQAMAAYDEGARLQARGESLHAIGPLEESVAHDPDFGIGWSALARAYADSGRHAKALAAADRAMTVFENKGGRAALAARAERAVLAGDPEEGAALLRQLVERYPNDVSAQVRLAEQLGELGQFDTAQERLKAVVEQDPNHPRAWFLLGKFAIISGDARAAVDDYLVRSLVVQNRLNSALGRGETFNAMGLAHEQLGELDIARQYYRNAAEARAVAEDLRGLAGTLSNIARLDMIKGDFGSARAELKRSLEALTEIGDRVGVADLQNDFGVLEEEAGDYAAARAHYREALQIRRDLGDALGLAESYVNVAFTDLILGDYDSAAVFANHAFQRFDEAGSARGRVAALEIIGKLNIARGDWEAALRAFVTCLELSRELDNPFSEAVAEGGLGRVAFYQGRPGAALEAWGRALEILEPLGDMRGLVEYELSRAELFLALHLVDDARAVLEKVAGWIGGERDGDQYAEYARLMGVAAAMSGDHESAAQWFETAQKLTDEIGSAALALKVDIAALRWTGADTQAAREAADRALALGDAPLRLEALELLAERQIAAGERDAANATVAQALRPPYGMENWIHNWRLNALAARIADDPAWGDAAREQAAAQLAQMIEATPNARREGFARIAEAEGIDVARP